MSRSEEERYLKVDQESFPSLGGGGPGSAAAVAGSASSVPIKVGRGRLSSDLSDEFSEVGSGVSDVGSAF